MSGIPSLNGNPSTDRFVYSPYSFYDAEDFDPTYSTFPMYGNYGMGGSIFSMAPMYGGGMMGGNPQDYFNQMKQYQQFYNDYNIDQQKMQRNADLRVNASMEAIQTTYNALKDKIQKNEQGQIEDAYNNFVQAVATAYGEGTEQEIKARASMLYAQLSGGKTLVQDLRENGNNPFLQGLYNSMAFGLYDAKSAEDNISAITGTPVATSDKVKQNLGRLAGAGIVGTVAAGISLKIAQIAGSASKLAKLAGKAGIVGLAVAGVAAGLSFLTGKATT